MCEILFRVKDDLSYEWLFGFPIIAEDKEACYFFTDEKDNIFHQHIVTRKTLGQYTGLTDKNGTKIFEGDICKFFNDDGETSLYSIEWDELNCRFAVRYLEAKCGTDELETNFAENCKVIGNIFDNSELLEDENYDE